VIGGQGGAKAPRTRKEEGLEEKKRAVGSNRRRAGGPPPLTAAVMDGARGCACSGRWGREWRFWRLAAFCCSVTALRGGFCGVRWGSPRPGGGGGRDPSGPFGRLADADGVCSVLCHCVLTSRGPWWCSVRGSVGRGSNRVCVCGARAGARWWMDGCGVFHAAEVPAAAGSCHRRWQFWWWRGAWPGLTLPVRAP
jgi:hypothetical protein